MNSTSTTDVGRGSSAEDEIDDGIAEVVGRELFVAHQTNDHGRHQDLGEEQW